MARQQRTRDVEAISKASEVANEVDASPEAKQTGIIIGARAYRLGERKAHNQIASLEAEVEELRVKLAAAEALAVFTPAEIGYIATLKRYGMKIAEIADHMGVTLDEAKEALRLHKDKTLRFKGDRQPAKRV